MKAHGVATAVANIFQEGHAYIVPRVIYVIYTFSNMLRGGACSIFPVFETDTTRK